MADEKMARCQLNPLAFPGADDAAASSTNEKPTLESALRFLCPAGEDAGIEKLLARYRDINTEPVRLFIAPAEQRILDKLIWPLRNAKACFMGGNYLGTISLSGMVAEMVAMLLWEIMDSQIKWATHDQERRESAFRQQVREAWAGEKGQGAFGIRHHWR
jgi:hypothetical protein